MKFALSFQKVVFLISQKELLWFFTYILFNFQRTVFVFAALIKRLVYNSMVRNTKSTAFLKKSKEIIRNVFSKFSNSLNPFSLNS